MTPSKIYAEWLGTENSPQLSDDLARRFLAALRSRSLTEEIIVEVDELIAAATKAIQKHYADEQAALVRTF